VFGQCCRCRPVFEAAREAEQEVFKSEDSCLGEGSLLAPREWQVGKRNVSAAKVVRQRNRCSG